MDLVKLHSNLKQLDVVDLAIEILDELEDFIADLNRSQMYDKGQRSDGSDISPDYTALTVELKERFGSGKGKRTDHVTLYDEGSFHKSIFSSVTIDKIVLDASDNKTDELLGKYGEVLGLTDESIEKLKAEFNKRFWPRFKNAIWK